MGIFNFLNKTTNEPDEIVFRTAFAFNKAISVGQKILATTFDKVKEIKGLNDDQDLNFSDEQGLLISKEVAKISLFWLTRDIWTYIVKNENDAKKVNLLLFSWFKDKYNVEHKEVEEYAKAAGTSEEVQIYGKNVARIFDCYGAIEILELNTLLISFFEEFVKNTKDAFSLPLKDIENNNQNLPEGQKDTIVRDLEWQEGITLDNAIKATREGRLAREAREQNQ